MKLLNKLKLRWGIESNWQVVVILSVFSFAGFTVVFARRFVFNLLGIVEQDPFWLKSIVWLLTVFPIYNIILLGYGTLLGQFDFFWRFFKKVVYRFVPGKSS